MKHKLYILGVMVLCIITLTACNTNKIKEDNRKAKERAAESNKTKELTDAEKFKEEYEKLNGTKSKSGKTIRKIEVDKNNPFVYKSAGDIVKMIESKETFLVYFGFPSCPWCRSILSTLISVSKDYNVDKIYYVNIYNIRDTKELDKDGKVTTTKEGSVDYMKLLEKFGSTLSDYVLTDEKGKEIKTGEKRIFSPNIIYVSKGKAKKITTGISDKQTDGYMELTDKMKDEMYKSIEKVIKEYSKDNSSCNVNSKDC